MGVLLLVRHGQASFASRDYDVLSELGHEQAGLLGQALAARGVTPDVLVRGGMRRHQESVAGVAAGAGWVGGSAAEVVEDVGWNEFDHVRVIEAYRPAYRNHLLMKADLARTLRPHHAFQQMFAAATGRWASGEFDHEYQETFSSFAARVVTALERTANLVPPSGTAVVVTSGGPIGIVAAQLLSGDLGRWAALNALTINTGTTKVISGRRGLGCVTFNEHTHLEHDRRLVTYR